ELQRLGRRQRDRSPCRKTSRAFRPHAGAEQQRRPGFPCTAPRDAMPDVISIALVGIGGYGNSYVSALLDAPNRDEFRIVGAIDPSPKLCRRLAELEARSCPVYAAIDDFYASTRADLAVISTPLHLHASQTCFAL